MMMNFHLYSYFYPRSPLVLTNVLFCSHVHFVFFRSHFHFSLIFIFLSFYSHSYFTPILISPIFIFLPFSFFSHSYFSQSPLFPPFFFSCPVDNCLAVIWGFCLVLLVMLRKSDINTYFDGARYVFTNIFWWCQMCKYFCKYFFLFYLFLPFLLCCPVDKCLAVSWGKVTYIFWWCQICLRIFTYIYKCNFYIFSSILSLSTFSALLSFGQMSGSEGLWPAKLAGQMSPV